MGDRVRLARASRAFQKGYRPTFTEELFTVSRVKEEEEDPVTYVVRDDHGHEVAGAFYDQELQRVAEKGVYQVEEIVAKRKGQYLVKWKGYDDSFNSWIPATALLEKGER